jgi:hypothetical protein
MKNNSIIIQANSNNFISDAVRSLKEDGLVIIRGLFSKQLMSEIDESWRTNFKHPSVSGTVGYFRTSHAKALLPLFLLGKPVFQVTLEKKIITIIEKVMKSKCTLAEANAVWHKATKYVYFPLHSDFAAGWKKTKNSNIQLTSKDMNFPIGIGGMLYLHDTKSGAFKYSLKSHKIQSKHGQHFANYPKSLKETINKNIFICKGIKGDLILFDDRGFHGPDQPSKKDRSVLLFDYYRDKTFGSVIVTPHLIKISDAAILDKDQLRVLGINASVIVPREEYVGTRFKKNILFHFIVLLIEKAYFFKHIKSIIKHYIKKFKL